MRFFIILGVLYYMGDAAVKLETAPWFFRTVIGLLIIAAIIADLRDGFGSRKLTT